MASNPFLSPQLTLSDLNDDVLLQICDHLTPVQHMEWSPIESSAETNLKNLAIVNKRLYNVVNPIVLRSVVICTCNKTPKKLMAGDWDMVQKAIRTLSMKPHILSNLRNVWFGIYTYRNKLSLDALPGPEQDDVHQSKLLEYIHEIVAFIRNLPNLRDLGISFPEDHLHLYRTAFEAASTNSYTPVSSSVRTLRINTHASFLLLLFPNIEEIYINGIELYPLLKHGGGVTGRTLRLARIQCHLSRATKVKLFHGSCEWSRTDLSVLKTCFPELRCLCLVFYRNIYSAAFDDLARLLGEGCIKLRQLEIPDVDKSILGSGRHYLDTETVAKKRRENEEYAAGVAFGNIASLEEFKVGTSLARRLKSGDEPEWAWTRE